MDERGLPETEQKKVDQLDAAVGMMVCAAVGIASWALIALALYERFLSQLHQIRHVYGG